MSATVPILGAPSEISNFPSFKLINLAEYDNSEWLMAHAHRISIEENLMGPNHTILVASSYHFHKTWSCPQDRLECPI